MLFHDGTQVSANDVGFSLHRALDEATQSPTAFVFLNDIQGALAFLSGEASDVSGIVARNDTVEITLESPRGYFLSKLANPVAFVVDRRNVESGPDWTSRPNGTGPFKLEKWSLGEEIVLTRNEDYYREPAFLQTARLILSGGEPRVLYESGEIDLIELSAADLEGISDPANPLSGETVLAKPDLSLTYIAFNHDMPPFDDAKVRQAFSLAIDKETVGTQIEKGLRKPAYGVLPPTLPGHSLDLTGLRFDPTRARQLIEQSAYGPDLDNFPRVVLTLPGSFGATGSPDIEAFIQMWRQNLGIEVELEQLEFGTFLEAMFQGELQAFNLQWVPDYPEPHAFLDLLFHSESSNNVLGYSNPEVDTLLEEARRPLAFDERASLYRAAELAVLEDAVLLPLWFSGDRHFLVKPHVKGFNPSPLVGLGLKRIYIVVNN